MIVAIIVASLLIGVSLGVLGGGGSILTVPILVYLAGMETKEAIATSLFVVGVTSAAGVVSHARAGRVRWRTGVLFGLAGMTGAYAGGRFAEFIPGSVLLIAFALMMIATALAMIRGRRGAPKKVHNELPVLHVLLEGTSMTVSSCSRVRAWSVARVTRAGVLVMADVIINGRRRPEPGRTVPLGVCSLRSDRGTGA